MKPVGLEAEISRKLPEVIGNTFVCVLTCVKEEHRGIPSRLTCSKSTE